MKATGPAVSVLVPVLDEAATIHETVAAMRAQQLPGGHEMIFLDGGSRDATRAILEEVARDDPRVRVLDNPARRVPQALNIGLREARGEYVARMDAHTFYPPDYLWRGVERLKQGGVVWVAGPQVPQGRSKWSRRIALALGSRLGVGGAGFRRVADEEFETDSGFTGVWHRDTLKAQGGWDEDWPVNQDSEMAARLRATGGRIVCVPEMAAAYIPRDSLAALARQYWRYGQYRVKTSRRHPSSMRRSHLAPPLLLVGLVGSVLPIRAAAPLRAAAGLYGVALLSAGALAAGRAEAKRDALFVPAVLATMHVSWAAGFFAGCLRFGWPVSAVGARARRRPRT